MAQHLDPFELAQCHLCVASNLRMTTRSVTQHFDNKLRWAGLRITQFSILVALAAAESMTITHLAEQMLLDRTTLTRNLKPLEREGLVQTSTGEDRRTRIVRLTDAGHERLARALPHWQKAQAQIVDALGMDRWRSILDDLAELVTLSQ